MQRHNDSLERYSAMVEETIDLDELAHHNYVLMASFDANLEQIRDQLIKVMDGLDAEHERAANELGLDMEKKLHLEKHNVYSYSLRVTKAVSTLVLLSSSCEQTDRRTFIAVGSRKVQRQKQIHRIGNSEIRNYLHNQNAQGIE